MDLGGLSVSAGRCRWALLLGAGGASLKTFLGLGARSSRGREAPGMSIGLECGMFFGSDERRLEGDDSRDAARLDAVDARAFKGSPSLTVSMHSFQISPSRAAARRAAG